MQYSRSPSLRTADQFRTDESLFAQVEQRAAREHWSDRDAAPRAVPKSSPDILIFPGTDDQWPAIFLSWTNVYISHVLLIYCSKCFTKSELHNAILCRYFVSRSRRIIHVISNLHSASRKYINFDSWPDGDWWWSLLRGKNILTWPDWCLDPRGWLFSAGDRV